VQATLDQLSVELKPGTPEGFGAFLAAEREKWLAVAKAANIQLD
jgi:tripartite-type tricarboxylate transporter receptor subunit TctC